MLFTIIILKSKMYARVQSIKKNDFLYIVFLYRLITMMCFVDNYFHEIPSDIQIHIMDTANKLKEEELKKVEALKLKIEEGSCYDEKNLYQKKCGGDVRYILWDLEDMDLEDEDEFYDEKHRIVDICSAGGDDFEEDNYDKIKKAVDYFGVFKAIKLGINEFGFDSFDIENEDEEMLYRKCYFHMLYDAFDYTYEDIKLIKEYNISTF